MSTPPADPGNGSVRPLPPAGRTVYRASFAADPRQAGAASRESRPLPPGGYGPPPRDPRRHDPRSPRRSRRARHPLVVIGNAIFTVVLLVAIAVGALLAVGKQRFEQPGPLTEDKIVNIPRGAGIRDIAELLNREGVIDQPWVFVGGVIVLKARDDLKYGEYRFRQQASLRDVVDIITSGRVVQHTFTVAEGLTSEQAVQRLLENDVLTGNIREIPREGTLLPETYHFTRGVTREQMITRMQQAHRKLLQEVWERRAPDLPIKTPEELVILASIIEKETGKPEERSRVAAVFVNRLKQKMRLQSDPTIIYGLVGGKGSLGRPIMKNEITQPTPYNTYVIDGLPPGPIASPGRASLAAAANPARTKELYFAADGTGGHAFAETYEQHLKNVARLRVIESEQKNDQKEAAPDAQAPANAGGARRTPPPRSQSAPARPTAQQQGQPSRAQ
jgi:UPF0755 protein